MKKAVAILVIAIVFTIALISSEQAANRRLEREEEIRKAELQRAWMKGYGDAQSMTLGIIKNDPYITFEEAFKAYCASIEPRQ